MLAKIRADLSKHWISWTGFIGLGVISWYFIINNPLQVTMAIIGWVLVCLGMYLETTSFGKNYKGDR